MTATQRNAAETANQKLIIKRNEVENVLVNELMHVTK